jgi:hypothetical protein
MGPDDASQVEREGRIIYNPAQSYHQGFVLAITIGAMSIEVEHVEQVAATFVNGDEDRGLGSGLLFASSMMFSVKASKSDHFEEAGWPSIVPSGFT